MNGNVEANTRPVKSNQRGYSVIRVIHGIKLFIMLVACQCLQQSRVSSISSSVRICTNCGLPNFSTTFFESDDNFGLSNISSSVSSDKIALSLNGLDLPYYTSSPKSRSLECSRLRKVTITVLNVNCQSLPAKRESFL